MEYHIILGIKCCVFRNGRNTQQLHDLTFVLYCATGALVLKAESSKEWIGPLKVLIEREEGVNSVCSLFLFAIIFIMLLWLQ